MVNFWTMLDQLGYPFMCSRCVLASRSPSIVLNLQMKFRSDACIGVVHVDGLRICGARSAGTGATAATSTPTSHTTRRISEHQSTQSRRNPNTPLAVAPAPLVPDQPPPPHRPPPRDTCQCQSRVSGLKPNQFAESPPRPAATLWKWSRSSAFI